MLFEQYKQELDHLQAENTNIHHEVARCEQEHRRDRLIDGASPEQKVVKQMEMSVEDVKRRSKYLKHQLHQIKEKIAALELEMDCFVRKADDYYC